MKPPTASWEESCLAQPIRAFHGTVVEGRSGQGFRKFDKSKLGTASGTSDSREGFWFTTSKERAIEAASDAKEGADSDGVSAEVFEVSLNLTNPLVVPTIKNLGPAEVADLARQAKRDGREGIVFAIGEGAGADYLMFGTDKISGRVAGEEVASRKYESTGTIVGATTHDLPAS